MTRARAQDDRDDARMKCSEDEATGPRFVPALALALALVVAGCGSAGESSQSRNSGSDALINLYAGSYKGIGVDDTQDEMENVFGANTAASLDESGTPLEPEESYGPVGFNPWPGNEKPQWFRYRHAAFFFARGEITVVMVTDPDAVTEGGVGIGDPLDAARDVYDLRCGLAHENSEFGPPYRACAGKIGPRRFVWFGGDPIANVTVGEVLLWGV